MNYTDELFEYARINYPPGTKFLNIYGIRIRELTVKGCEFYTIDDNTQCHNRICILIEEKADSNDGGVTIYSKEKGWAKIIKKGEPCYEIY